MNKLRVALCQMTVVQDKKENLAKARYLVEKAVGEGAQIVSLPEMFNCPYDISNFRTYGEQIPQGETVELLAQLASKYRIYLIGGSIPEIGKEDRIFNTSLLFDPAGRMIGKHRKVHLFDIAVKGGAHFQESAVLTAGEEITLVDTPWGKIGVMICYDIRFPELARIMATAGAKIIFVPAAFNLTTGPAHWHTLFKSRALDNQIFVLGTSPARNPQASYQAYGHSLVVNPWGQVTAELDDQEGILVTNLNLTQIDEVRGAIPVWNQRRIDVYNKYS